MAEYRIYYFDPDVHIFRADAFECADDAKAEVIARSRANGHAVELWNLDRRIGRFESPPRPGVSLDADGLRSGGAE
jgi:hypothetical protein